MTAQNRITCRPVEVPELFGISTATVYRWAQKGHVKIHKRAGTSFIIIQDMIDYITGLGDQLGDQRGPKK